MALRPVNLAINIPKAPQIEKIEPPQISDLPIIDKTINLNILFDLFLDDLKTITELDKWVESIKKEIEKRLKRFDIYRDFIENEYVRNRTNWLLKTREVLTDIFIKEGFKCKNTLRGSVATNLLKLDADFYIQHKELNITTEGKLRDTAIELITALRDIVKKVNDFVVEFKQNEYTIVTKAMVLEAMSIVASIERDLKNLQINYTIKEADTYTLRLKNSQNQISISDAFMNAEIEALKSELHSTINDVNFSKAKYRIGLKYYDLIDGEIQRFINAAQNFKLNLMKGVISRVNAATKEVNSVIELNEAKLNKAENIVRINNAVFDVNKTLIDTLNNKINLETAKAEIEFNSMMTSIASYRNVVKSASLAVEEADIRLLDQFVSYKLGQVKKLDAYTVEKELSLIDDIIEAVLKTQAVLNENIFKMQLNAETDIVRGYWSAVGQGASIITNALSDWYRTCAVTSARITASYIRSYE